MSAPEWTGDRIVDPDGDYLWLAVDVYPTLPAAQAEAGDAYAAFEQPEDFTLRWLDSENEDDRYLAEEWGCTTTVDPAEEGTGRAFWAFGPPSDVASHRSDQEGGVGKVVSDHLRAIDWSTTSGRMRGRSLLYELEAEVERLREALAFFADGGMYEAGGKWYTVPWSLQVRAREALDGPPSSRMEDS